MAYIQRREHKHRTTWRVMFRVDKQMVSETFAYAEGAAEFAQLVDRIGGKAACEVLAYRRGSPKAGRVPTVAQALTDHIDSLHSVTIGTRRDYEKIAKLISDSALGKLPVDAVTRDAVGKWVAGQAAAAKTIRNRHSLLYAALKRQVEAGNIAANPCDGVRIGRTVRAEMTILSPDELNAILDHLPRHWHPIVITLAGTGLRFSEATALQVRDIDLSADPPVLRVARSWTHTDGAERLLGAPKTERGRRVVSLPPEVVTVLRPLLAGRHRDAFVLTNTRGRPIRQNSFHEIWSRALDDADIGKRPRIHDLRHTHVSWLIAAGVPLPVIQRRLGHEDITTTVNTYGHLADDALSIAAQAASLPLAGIVPELVEQSE